MAKKEGSARREVLRRGNLRSGLTFQNEERGNQNNRTFKETGVWGEITNTGLTSERRSLFLLVYALTALQQLKSTEI